MVTGFFVLGLTFKSVIFCMLCFWFAGYDCEHIWTGGYSNIEGSINTADWNWYYTSDFSGASKPATYLSWAANQPNNYGGDQHVIHLSRSSGEDNYDFNDMWLTGTKVYCFLCECP